MSGTGSTVVMLSVLAISFRPRCLPASNSIPCQASREKAQPTIISMGISSSSNGGRLRGSP